MLPSVTITNVSSVLQPVVDVSNLSPSTADADTPGLCLFRDLDAWGKLWLNFTAPAVLLIEFAILVEIEGGDPLQVVFHPGLDPVVIRLGVALGLGGGRTA